MKLLAIYILSLLSLSQSLMLTSTNLYNANELIKHYNFHKTEYNNSFYEFLDLHFGEKREYHANDRQHSDHEKLPFKECQFHIHNHNLALLEIFFDFELLPNFYKSEINAAYIENFDSLKLSLILHSIINNLYCGFRYIFPYKNIYWCCS